MKKDGVTIQDAPKKNSIEVTEEHLQQLRYDPNSVWGYVEIHIEQGPVLEWVGFPLGVVKGIAGQTRLKASKVTMRGSQGHAGPVPMSMRHDLMAAAAEAIVLLESLCKHPQDFLSFDGQCKSYSLESLSTYSFVPLVRYRLGQVQVMLFQDR
ncbi:putative allantoate deiminase [Rosa chinensis]|uniref:Putative allantoate deiminase n=1 Tax=Rosa chinensis TaxID=74649 RepID=A0A2P6S7B8_ROSCH|nr:putative allantoate deiminase [Rosa chinensis]